MIRGPKTILALLTALNLLNYLDRMVLSAVLAPVQADLHLSNSIAGSLSTIFLIGYFATSPVFGTLGDRVGTGGRTRLISLGIAVWSAATVASGFARGAGWMIASRAFVGVGEASYATLAPVLIDDIAPADRKSRWMAIFYSATPIGSALGYLVGGAVLHAHGWRAAFFVAGGPGLAVALLCLFIAEPPRKTRDAHAQGLARLGEGPAANPALSKRRPRLLRIHVRAWRPRVLGARLSARAPRTRRRARERPLRPHHGRGGIDRDAERRLHRRSRDGDVDASGRGREGRTPHGPRAERRDRARQRLGPAPSGPPSAPPSRRPPSPPRRRARSFLRCFRRRSLFF